LRWRSLEELKLKSRVLLKEATIDLEVGCYNKAVSAAYFAVRIYAESLLKLRTRKDDKIANAVARALSGRHPEKANEARVKFLELFEARKIADHRPRVLSKSEAEYWVSEAKALMSALKLIGE